MAYSNLSAIMAQSVPYPEPAEVDVGRSWQDDASSPDFAAGQQKAIATELLQSEGTCCSNWETEPAVQGASD